MAKFTYNPTVFSVPDEDAAKQIILQGAAGVSTDERWAKETPYLADLLADKLKLRPGHVVIDYGCGIGRMAKALIEKHKCIVLGVDISTEMRGLAPAYVGASTFSIVSRKILYALLSSGFRADAAISVWTLQHCANPEDDVQMLKAALKPGGALGVVNMVRRAVPTVETKWRNDGLDMQALVERHFLKQEVGQLAAEHVSAHVADATYWASYRLG